MSTKLDIFSVLGQRPASIFSVEFIKNSKVVVGFDQFGIEGNSGLVFLLRLVEFVQVGIQDTEV